MKVNGISWRPVLVKDLEGFLREHPGAEVVDTVASQLEELYAARHLDVPFSEFADELSASSAHYWVPWRGVLVRTLGRVHFAQLLSARSRVLFSPSDFAQLAVSRVGIAGMSVGSRVLEPLAHGPEFLEIRLADMDVVTSTSLGRLPAGIADLGTPKVVLGARIVTGVRPWANLTLFDQGLSPDNLEEFLRGLDIVVCAMDDPVMKLSLRKMAAAMGVDVIMGTDIETGLIDFEPYRTDPGHQPFHGQVSEGTLQYLENPVDPTPQKMIAAIAEIVGLQNLTPSALRMAAALISGQLASMSQLSTTATIVGGAVARMIHLRLCGHSVQTGRINLGIEGMLRGGLSIQEVMEWSQLFEALTEGLKPTRSAIS